MSEWGIIALLFGLVALAVVVLSLYALSTMIEEDTLN
jgi:uncharacterized membrane protein HdeD (DUF308 family)